MTFGSDRRKLSSWLDGFAKLHSLKFDGRNVYFSGKMIASSTYMDSVEKGELVPQFTLSTFQNPEDEWTYWEYLEIMQRGSEQYNGESEHNLVSLFIAHILSKYFFVLHTSHIYNLLYHSTNSSSTISTLPFGAWGQG